MNNLDKIFKAYDIRGVYPDELNEEVGYKIGRATVKFLKAKEVVVGRDNRNSSDNLFKVLSEGIRDQGVNVIDIGLTTTPMFYFAVAKWGIKGGIMITASHNPPEYNGFKVVQKDAMPVSENSGLKKIKKLVEKNKFKTKNRGEIKKRVILKEYIENVLRFNDLGSIRPFKISVDTNGGTAKLVISELFKKLPIQEVSERADLGISFDGDGDRIVFIDEKGKKIAPDLITVLLIHYFFKNKKKILYTVIASQIVKQEIKKTGNTLICSEVGHTFIKEKMKNKKIDFGAESSGHYYLKDNYFNESPFLILLKVLEILSKEKKPLSELVKPFQKYYLERINFEIKNVGLAATRHIIKEIEKKYKKIGKISRLDGLTIEFPDWWFNLRPSHTEPVIRLTLEAKTKELLEEKKKELCQLIGLN
ncbi:MAG TPA: phosphomannomutase/phosphoglucomutase [bacterium]|nr:phosphomannomutase/phosphoglucomutase [bacterium]